MKTIEKKHVETMGSRRKRYVAFHEAGHAVVADFFGVGFVVSIGDEPKVSLETTYIAVACQVVFGGPLAQAKYQRRGLFDILITEGCCDMEYIEAQAEMWDALGLKDTMRSGWKKGAQKVISERWDLVTAVAERLIECGTLTSEEVRTIASGLGHEGQDHFVPYDRESSPQSATVRLGQRTT